MGLWAAIFFPAARSFAQLSRRRVAWAGCRAVHAGRVTTLRELYCLANDCAPTQFVGRVFWRTLYPQALLLAPVVTLFHRDYFQVDRELIVRIGGIRTWGELNEEIRDYVLDSRTQGWWRRRMHVRLSTRRLRALAQLHLPEISRRSRRAFA